MRQRLALLLLPLLATVAAAHEPPRYSALETLQKAQVGTFSPRLETPPRQREARQVKVIQFEGLKCRTDPSRPLTRAVVCEPRK